MLNRKVQIIEDYCNNVIVPNSNSYQAQYSLIIGYNDAVNILLNEIETSRKSVNLLFYPIFFCARHSLELQFKLLINMVNDFNNYRNSEKNKITIYGHNLRKLSDKLKEVISYSDRRISDYYKKVDVESLLNFFDTYDSTSQSFRYLFDNKGERFIKSNFNIVKPIKDYQDLFVFLEWMDEVINELYKEYGTKTYAKKLSRNDLVIIAKRLPNKEEWGNKTFLYEKDAIKADFSLSNYEFSDAINKIKANPYLCSLIGMEIPEEGFSDEFFHLYSSMKAIMKKRESFVDALIKDKDGFRIMSFEELYADKDISDCDRIMNECISKLTDDDCILYNTYRCIDKYCEEFEYRKEHFYKGSSQSLRIYTNDKMTTSGFLRFEEGLQLCGRTTVLRKLGIPLKDNIDGFSFVF